MYNLITIQDTIRIPPKLFSTDIKESITKALREQYEGIIDKDIGVIITVLNPREVSDGRIIHGDGGAYHNITFDAVSFKPEIHEVIKGKINDIAEFGAFVRFGPIDGLIHVSQVTDDFMSYNEKTGTLSGKESKKNLKKEDVVTARVIAVSIKNNVAESKINLTMRQEGLGKTEWNKKKKKTTVTATKKKKKKQK